MKIEMGRRWMGKTGNRFSTKQQRPRSRGMYMVGASCQLHWLFYFGAEHGAHMPPSGCLQHNQRLFSTMS